jgi:signal transduction histidine kinase
MHELAKAGIQSCVSLPLQDNEKPFGALTLGWEQRHGYDDSQIAVLHQIADAIALGIERSRLFQTTRHRTQELKLLYQVISAAASGGAKEDILQTSCDEIASFLNVPHITLILLEDPLKIGSFEAAEAIVGAQFITPGEPDLKGQHLSFNAQNLLLTSLAHAGQPIVIEQLSNYPLSSRMSGLANMYNLVSALILPIVLRSKIIGIIGIGSKKSRTFTHHEIHLLEKVSEELGRVLETASLYEQLRNYAADLEIRVVERTQELAEANEQLKQLDKLKSRFVTDVSHELRTPVTNLKLYLDLLERKGPEKLNQYLPILQKQADRLGQLIQDILDLSRLELGRHKVEFEPLNLNTLVEEIVEAHLPRAQASDLNLSFNPDANLPQILGVRNQLAQIITNLLVNAINYTLAGDILLTTQAEPETGFACLTVADTGMGITFEDIPYLFDRFYRGEQARESNIPGTGLGLAIADEIVRIHDGRIEVSSSAGKGTTFKVWLPLFQEHAK